MGQSRPKVHEAKFRQESFFIFNRGLDLKLQASNASSTKISRTPS